MKSRFRWVFAALAALVAADLTAADYRDSVIAVVNEEVVTLYDVVSFTRVAEEMLLGQYTAEELQNPDTTAQVRTQVQRVRERAAQELVDQQVLWAEFARRGYQVPNELVEKRVDRIVQQRAGGSWEEFQKRLQQNEMTLNQYRDQVRRRLAVDMLVKTEVDSRIGITPARISAYYQANLQSLAEPAQVQLQMMVFKTPEGGKPEAAESRLRQARERLAKGEEFAAVARDLSQDERTREAGGVVGWIAQKDLREDFRQAFAAVTAGQVSSPVRLGQDFYLLRLAEVKDTVTLPLDDAMRRKIENRLFEEERRTLYEKYVSELRSRAYIRTFFKSPAS